MSGGIIINKKIKDENLDFLFEAILSLKSVGECYDFFDDLCTVSEIKALSQRLHVARMLKSHYVYSDIVRETGASTATISRVNRCLNYGSDGYGKILERLEKNKE
ncbi:MAG TPA: YerC/YecD family TrpR-related protein [Ruminiclostridium sp.]|nr:YerC/YecD family TrpR-related protein [Ruminiclostridium sp.]